MKLKKLLSIFAAAAIGASCLTGFSISASAATEADVVAINSDYTYWFDDVTTNGTVTVNKGTLFGNDHFYTSTGNTAASNKGSVTVDGASHLNSLRLKNIQDKLMFKVSAPATITFYTQSHGSRGIVVTNTDPTASYGTYDAAVTAVGSANKVQTVSTTTWTYETTGAETIYLSSYGGDFYIAGIAVSGLGGGDTAASYTTVYDLPALVSGGGIQYITGTLAPSSTDEGSNAPDITVDATNGKLGPNGDWAQINEGTVITIPGVPAGAKINFAEFFESTALTINGVEYNSSNKTYTAAETADVVMTCTTGGYIKAITVVGPAFGGAGEEPEEPEEPAANGYTNTWQFGKSNGATEFALQRSAEYTYTVNGYSLVVNTDAGKLNNANRNDTWSQCNDGTTFKVPVYAGSKLTWGRYTTTDAAGFTIDGTLYNTYYIAKEAGTVNMSATGISYLSYIQIEPAPFYAVSGSIDTAVNGETITFTGVNGQTYTAEVSNGAYAASLPADTYTSSISGSGYVISAPASFTVSGAATQDITVSAAAKQSVTGEITNAPTSAFTLTFTPASGAAVTADLAANATSYSVQLDPGTYNISSSVGTLSALSQESFTVVNSDVAFNIYYPETIPAATSTNITVDKNAVVAANVYKSVSDALAAAKAGNITAPVITLTSGQTYREQVIVNMPDVTFKTSGSGKAKITWYYGIGYSYYSLGSDGYYNKDRAMTRNSINLRNPDRWGASVRVTGEGFKAENVIFENSLNQYYTDEEAADGVTPSLKESIRYDRTLRSGENGYYEADTKAVTERGAAIALDANKAELYNCEFIGSQDTFYTGGTAYVKNCKITGNTDYIFGGGNVVFDNCDLIWGGYSDSSYPGFITASNNGTYVFRNCTIKSGTAGGRIVNGGNYGRDWGGTKANVYFFNTTDTTGNTSESWSNMGGAVAAGTANLHIYDFDLTDNTVNTSTGVTGANVNGELSHDDAKAIYEGAAARLGFTPSKMINAVTEASANQADTKDTVYGYKTTVTAGSDITARKIDWVVSYNGTTKVLSSNGVTGDTKIPEITGGSVSVFMLFHGAADTTYNVLSTAE